MKLNAVKFLAIILFVIPVLALAFFKTSPVRVAAKNDDTEIAALYKKNCALCHKPNAEKFFDPSQTDEALIEIILKGKKAEKPPHMPAYQEKGVTSEQAKQYVEYMRKIKTPPAE
jgi:mono/diheme cytochrome c family protein